MNLSAVEEIDISSGADDRVVIRWRQGGEWSEFAYIDQNSGYVDAEEVLWWLLRHDAPLECIRRALVATYPDFDVDDEINRTTMPDRDDWRAWDQQRRADARAVFRSRRRKT